MNEQKLTNVILYVEDDKLIQLSMISTLENAGFTVLAADSGVEALNILETEKGPIDGLMTDVNLGNGPTGWNVARCARRRLMNMPVVYASSVGNAEWMTNGVPLSQLVNKPFRPTHAVNAISALLATAMAQNASMIERMRAAVAAREPAKDPAVTETILKAAPDTALETVAPAASLLMPSHPAAGKPWVVGTLGQKLSREGLPPVKAQWTPRRKAEVVAAVAGGLLTPAEALDRYELSVEEFAGWQRAVERSGWAGLRQTRTQHYRDANAQAQQFGWAA